MSENGIARAFNDRLNSEILGTFSLSMILCCWKIWIEIFSSEAPAIKIQKVDAFLFSSQIFMALGEALLATLFILFIIPELKIKYEIWSANRRTKVAKAEFIRIANFATDTNGIRNNFRTARNADDELMGIKIQLDQHISSLESFINASVQNHTELAQGFSARVNNFRNCSNDIQSCSKKIAGLGKAIEAVSVALPEGKLLYRHTFNK